MRRFVSVAFVATVVSIVLVAGNKSASAIPPFKKQWDAKYVKPDSAEAADQDFAAKVKEAKCNVCHVPKKKKTERNAYGNLLAELLDKKKDAKNKEKIDEAIAKVGAMKIKPGDESSPTWDEWFQQGKLPGEVGEN